MTESMQTEYVGMPWGSMGFLAAPNDNENSASVSDSELCLRSAPIFSNLTDAHIAIFQNEARPRSYKKGKVLYLEEESAEYFYVILSGWIKLFHTMPEGDEVIIDMLTKGDLVGESAIFEKGFHTSSAQIVEDTRLLCIPMHTLRDQISRSASLAYNMLSALSRHHRRACGEMALHAKQSAPQRVGYFLLKFCPKNKRQSIKFALPYDKTLIASALGMKNETFSRALNSLRQNIGLRIVGASVEINSVEQLAGFVYTFVTPSPYS